MRVVSKAFADGGIIPDDYACTGKNVNPPLEIYDIPVGTETLALSLVDLDNEEMVHWVIWNIYPNTSVRLFEGDLPSGAMEGRNDFGESKYHGPCPEDDTVHRYQFTAYALNETMSLGSNYELHSVMEAMEDHIIETAQMIGKYDAESSILG